ncbi:hypothetical protein ACOMHN_040490 [Nucella lapillus]
MAASLLFRRATSRVLRGVHGGVFSPCKLSLACPSRRYLLSEAYSCKETWTKRLDDPLLNQVPLSEFAIQLRDQYEDQKRISAVDMEILANKLHEMDSEEVEFMEDLMKKFRKSPDANPVRDSIMYIIVRSYIEKNMAERLLPLMQERSQWGLFPDPLSASLLLDHFIKEDDYASAAQVAYELMLQEELTHPTSRLLSLYAVTHYLEETSLDDLAPEEIEDPAGEVEDVPVKYIRYPTYDDHFDIRSQQYLLGKTLHHLGKTVEQGTLASSLQVTGLALHHKLAPCLRLLSSVVDSGDGAAVVRDCLTFVEKSLESVQMRDPEKPEKEMGEMRMEDELYRLLPTQEEREEFQARFQDLRRRLEDQGKVVEDKLSSLVTTLVQSELSQHEGEDIEAQTQNLQQWRGEREALLQEQLQQLEKTQKVQEIELTLKDLQDKEEMLRFFELYDKIRLTQPKKLPKEKGEEKEEDEEVLRAKRIKRRKYRHNV